MKDRIKQTLEIQQRHSVVIVKEPIISCRFWQIQGAETTIIHYTTWYHNARDKNHNIQDTKLHIYLHRERERVGINTTSTHNIKLQMARIYTNKHSTVANLYITSQD